MRIKSKYALLGENLDIHENVIIEFNDNHIISIEESEKDIKSNNVLIPGFFNSHVHAADIGLRGVKSDELERLVGPDGIKHRYLNAISDGELQSRLYQSYNEAIQFGTLGWADFREGGLLGLSAYKYIDNDNFIPLIRPLENEIDSLQAGQNIGIRSIRAYDEDILSKLVNKINENKDKSYIHVSEGIKLRNLWIKKYNMTDIEHAIKLDIDVLVHITHANMKDIELIKNYDKSVILCLSSNIFTNSGKPPIDELIKSGIRIGIGTDNAFINKLSMWEEMHLLKDRIDAKRLLSIATIEGAKISGLNWGIAINNSNFMELKIKSNLRKDNLYQSIIDMDHSFIENRFY